MPGGMRQGSKDNIPPRCPGVHGVPTARCPTPPHVLTVWCPWHPCILIILCPPTSLVSPTSLPPDVPRISMSPASPCPHHLESPLHPHRLVSPTSPVFPLPPGCCPCPLNAHVPNTLHPLLPLCLPPPLRLRAEPPGLAMMQWLKTRVANP